jgi:hypothetical protein
LRYQTGWELKVLDIASGGNVQDAAAGQKNSAPAFFVKKTAPDYFFPVLARRKPVLLSRLFGLLLLRLATRTFCGLLFHDPPRNTRLEPLAERPNRYYLLFLCDLF